MAGFEYSDLKGNGVLLKAVEYLRMLPKWKEQPGTLRSGFVEYAARPVFYDRFFQQFGEGGARAYDKPFGIGFHVVKLEQA